MDCGLQRSITALYRADFCVWLTCGGITLLVTKVLRTPQLAGDGVVSVQACWACLLRPSHGPQGMLLNFSL